jgi:hypothetical protein
LREWLYAIQRGGFALGRATISLELKIRVRPQVAKVLEGSKRCEVFSITARAERDFASLRDDIDAEESNAALKRPQYRAIYRVLEQRKQVDVLHIRHGARRRFRTSDIARRWVAE